MNAGNRTGYVGRRIYSATAPAGKAPSQQTEIKILYDDTYLYIGLICHDSEPEKIRDILGRRDENMGDMAGVAIDSYNDRQTAFEFNVTAAGQKVDLMHLGEYGWDFNWDAVWDGKASVGDSAWLPKCACRLISCVMPIRRSMYGECTSGAGSTG
jgi:hypothetical protein